MIRSYMLDAPQEPIGPRLSGIYIYMNILLNNSNKISEWDKLVQNPHLAFYQIGPWLCPKYSIIQSLETQFALSKFNIIFHFSQIQLCYISSFCCLKLQPSTSLERWFCSVQDMLNPKTRRDSQASNPHRNTWSVKHMQYQLLFNPQC